MSFDLHLISKYRTQIMGIAILWVMFFHMTFDLQIHEYSFIYTLKRHGNFGVDMFLFISGIGIYHSWNYTCNKKISTFYKRRFIRIIPIYVVFVTIYSIYIIWRHGSPVSVWFQFVTMSHFWTSNYVSFWKFWYIPAIVFMYVISPFFFKIARGKYVITFFISTFLLLMLAGFASLSSNGNILYSVLLPLRVIIFLFGIIIGYLIEKKTVIRAETLIAILIGSVVVAILHHHWLQETWLNMPPTKNYIFSIKFWLPYILLTPPLCILFSKILSLFSNYKFPILSFLGTYSLSLYLWHQPIMQGIDTFISNPFISNPISFALTIPVAHIFQKTVYYLTDKIIK